jgi:hypothetical protein
METLYGGPLDSQFVEASEAYVRITRALESFDTDLAARRIMVEEGRSTARLDEIDEELAQVRARSEEIARDMQGLDEASPEFTRLQDERSATVQRARELEAEARREVGEGARVRSEQERGALQEEARALGEQMIEMQTRALQPQFQTWLQSQARRETGVDAVESVSADPVNVPKRARESEAEIEQALQSPDLDPETRAAVLAELEDLEVRQDVQQRLRDYVQCLGG